MRVYELADELGVRSVDVLDACDDVGLAGIDAGSDLTDDQVKRVRFAFNQREVSALDGVGGLGRALLGARPRADRRPDAATRVRAAAAAPRHPCSASTRSGCTR